MHIRYESLCSQQTACRRSAAGRTAFDKNGFVLEWGGVGQNFFFRQANLVVYPHMRAKFGRDPMAVSKKWLLTL